MLFDYRENESGRGQFEDAQTYHGSVDANILGTQYLGLASIVAINEVTGVVNVRLATGGYASATMAVAGFYRPAIDDQVLAISQDGKLVYVIGVLQTSSPSTWSVPGDLIISVPKGSIRVECAETMHFKSQRQIDIVSPRMALRAGRLELVARRLVQRVDNVYLWVKELFQVKSRRSKTVADECFLVKTGRARMKSEGDFNINGKTINLG